MSTITQHIGGDTPASVMLLTLVRADTGAAVAVPDPLPQPFNHTGGTLWTYGPFADPAAVLFYLYSYQVTWSDGTYYQSADAIAGGTIPASGYYTTQARIETRFGKTNADQSADVDSAGTAAAIVAAFQNAIDETDRLIDWTAASYGLPSPIPTSAAYFGVVQDVATAYAYATLYERRGFYDTGEKGLAGKMSQVKAEAEARLTRVLYTALQGTVIDAQPQGFDPPRATNACGVTFPYGNGWIL